MAEAKTSDNAARGRWWRAVSADLAVRQGIKLAVAGMIGFFCAQWLRLPNPTWCLFTVVVLMLARYVGAIAEKSLLRVAGTFVGALLGIGLVGNFGNDWLVLLTGVFVLTAIGTALFGGNRYPYAFFLGALTLLVVVGTAMKNPESAWIVGMNRLLEICLGIIVAMVVSTVLWPQYARADFRAEYRAALRDAGRIAMQRSRRLLENSGSAVPEPGIAALEKSFATRMNKLRLLLHFGQRESEYFRAKVAIGSRIAGEINALFEAAVSLDQRLPEESRYRNLVGSELHAIHQVLEEEFDILPTLESGFDAKNPRLEEAMAACDARLRAVREAGLARDISIREAMDFSAHYTAIKDIAMRLGVIRECIWELVCGPMNAPSQRVEAREPFRVSEFWIRNGIKSAVTAVVALVYVNWFNPPGGGVVPFAAWLLTASPKLYPGGQGDRRAFTYVLIAALLGIPYVVFLVSIVPLLASYFWMNVFLAAGLFLLGFAITRAGGISIWGQLGMLWFVSAVGLNPQEPVGFQQIAGCYFGVLIALVISAVVQRLLWPLLPQREILSLFQEFFRSCRRLLGPKLPEREFTGLQSRLALIPSELTAWIQVARTPEYPKGEQERLAALLSTAERLGYSILSSRKLNTIDLPDEIRSELKNHITVVETSCRDALGEFEESFHRGRQAPQAQPLAAEAFAPLEAHVAEVRRQYLAGAFKFPDAIAFLGAMNFLEDTTRHIDNCAAQLRQLKLEDYAGDYSL